MVFDNASRWYAFILEGYDIKNGDLCIVTGCTKAPYAAIGVYKAVEPDAPTEFWKRMAFPLSDSTDYFVRNILFRSSRSPVNIEIDFTREIPVGSDPSSVRHGTIPSEHSNCITARCFYVSLHPTRYNSHSTARTTIAREMWAMLPFFLRPRVQSWPLSKLRAPVSDIHSCPRGDLTYHAPRPMTTQRTLPNSCMPP